MADEEQSPDEELADDEFDSEGSFGGGKKKIILFAVLALLVAFGGVAGVYFSGILDGPETSADAGPPPLPVKTVFYNLPETLTNLNGNDQRPSFLKTKVILEINEGTDIDRLDRLKPRIIDVLQVFLRELRIDDLRGTQGLIRIREALLARINEAVKPTKVYSVLFHEILVQ